MAVLLNLVNYKHLSMSSGQTCRDLIHRSNPPFHHFHLVIRLDMLLFYRSTEHYVEFRIENY